MYVYEHAKILLRDVYTSDVTVIVSKATAQMKKAWLLRTIASVISVLL